MSRILFCVVMASVPSVSDGQVTRNDPIVLKVSPVAAPDAALKYRLATARRDLKPGNAATNYNRAFAILIQAGPHVVSRFHDEPVVHDGRESYPHLRWLETPLDKLPRHELKSELAAYELFIREVEIAAQQRDCYWQVEERRDGLLLTLPELPLFRSLGRVLALRTRLQIAEGKYEQAITSMRTSLALSHQLCQGPTQDHLLVGISLTHTTLDRVEELMQCADAPNLYWALAVIPSPFCNLQPSVDEDRDVVTRMFPVLNSLEREPVTKEVVGRLDKDIQMWIEDLEGEGAEGLKLLARKSSYPDARKRMLLAGVAEEVVDGMPKDQVVIGDALNQYRATHDVMTKWLHHSYHHALPHVEKAFPAFQRASVRLDAILTGGCLTQLDLGQGFSETWASATRLDRRIAALILIESYRDHAARSNAGLLAIDLPKTLPLRVDPVTGQSFSLTKNGNRLELESIDDSFSLQCILKSPLE